MRQRRGVDLASDFGPSALGVPPNTSELQFYYGGPGCRHATESREHQETTGSSAPTGFRRPRGPLRAPPPPGSLGELL